MKCSCAQDIETCPVHDWSQFLETYVTPKKTKERHEIHLMRPPLGRNARNLARELKKGESYI